VLAGEEPIDQMQRRALRERQFDYLKRIFALAVFHAANAPGGTPP